MKFQFLEDKFCGIDMTTNEERIFPNGDPAILPVVDLIDANVRKVKTLLKGKPVSSDLVNDLKGVNSYLSSFQDALGGKGNVKDIYKLATQIAMHSLSIGIALAKDFERDAALKSFADDLQVLGHDLSHLASQQTVIYMPDEQLPRQNINRNIGKSKPSDQSMTASEATYDFKSILDTQSAAFRDKINQFKTELTLTEKRHRDSLEDFSKRIIDFDERINELTSHVEHKLVEANGVIEDRIGGLKDRVEEKLSAVNDLYTTTLNELDEKKQEVVELVGIITGGVMAGDYAKSAESEKTMADWLRYGSLACMFAIACVVGYSLYETTTAAFKWENALFRLVFSVLLSVPAAYLARESGKHRQQQYTHLQTSLDLKSITPYLASLPESEQHRLKADIATRLFATRDFSSMANDSYPINTQEIIMALLNKLNYSSDGKKSNEK